MGHYDDFVKLLHHKVHHFMDMGGPDSSATAMFPGAHGELPSCSSLQTMGKGGPGISAIAGLAGPQIQLLLCRSPKTMGRGDFEISAICRCPHSCCFTGGCGPWTKRILASQPLQHPSMSCCFAGPFGPGTGWAFVLEPLQNLQVPRPDCCIACVSGP